MLAVQNLSAVCDMVLSGSPLDTNMITPARCQARESRPANGKSPVLGRHCRRLRVLAPLPAVAYGWAADIITAHQATPAGINLLVLPPAGWPVPLLPLEVLGLDEVSAVRIAPVGKDTAPPSLCLACEEIVLLHNRNASPALSAIYPGPGLEAIIGALDLLWSVAEPAGPAAGGVPPGQVTGLLEQFAAGVTDRAAQRALSISGRTLSRRAAELLSLLNSRNRFQAGAEAARRKWI